MPDVVLIWSEERRNSEPLLRSGPWTITRIAPASYELRYDGVLTANVSTPQLAKELATTVEKSKVSPISETDFAQPGLKVFITKPNSVRLGVTVGSFRPDVSAGVFLYSVDTGAAIKEFPATELVAREDAPESATLVWVLETRNSHPVYRSGPWTIKKTTDPDGDSYDIHRDGLPVTTVYDLGVAQSLAQHIGTQHLDDVRSVIDRVSDLQRPSAPPSTRQAAPEPIPLVHDERAERILMAEIERLRLRCLELEALRVRPAGPSVLSELYEELNQVTDYEAGFTSSRLAYISGQRAGLQSAIATVIRTARAGAPLESPEDDADALGLIDERDEAQAWADLLAGVIASPDEIGEFSNINNPFVNALEIARDRASERNRLAGIRSTLTRELSRVSDSCDAALLAGNAELFNRLNVGRSAFSFALQLLGFPSEEETANLTEEFTTRDAPAPPAAEQVELLWEDYRTNSWSKFGRVTDLGDGRWRVELRDVDVESREAAKALSQAVKNTIDRASSATPVPGGPLLSPASTPEVTPLVWEDSPTRSRNDHAKVVTTDDGWQVRLRNVTAPTRAEAKQLAACAISAISKTGLATSL